MRGSFKFWWVPGVAAVLALGLLVSVSGANHGTTQLVSSGPAGGNGAFPAIFARATPDAAHVFFTTDEPLVADDTDTQRDIYQRSGSTTTRISTGSAGGNGNIPAFFSGASADGTRVFFRTNESLVAGDTDARQDVYERSGSATTLVSTGPAGGSGAYDAFFSGASADGTRVFFLTDEPLEASDIDLRRDIYERSGATTTRISTGTAGGNGAFHALFSGASADGTRVFFITDEPLVVGDTDSRSDIYERSGSTTTRISTGSAGGNGNITAFFSSASTDGTRVYFETEEPLEPGDTDTRTDVYLRSGSITTRISTGSAGGNSNLYDAYFDGASADGTRLIFETGEVLETDDTDARQDIYERSGSTTTRLSTGPAGGNDDFDAFYSGATPDGTQVYFDTDEPLEAADTDAAVDIYERFGTTTTRMSTGSAGGNGSLNASFERASADGTRVFINTLEALEPDDTDGARDVYERFGSTTTRISSGPGGGNGPFDAGVAVASTDGTRVLLSTSESLVAGDTDAQPDVYAAALGVTTGYPRPQSAPRMRVALVPAHDECTDPNSSHGPPLDSGSCKPPNRASNHLTVGTPDANGPAANSSGYVKFIAQVGAPGGADEAEALVNIVMSDVRNQGTLTDYTGELRVVMRLRITDRAGGSGGTLPATMVDLPLDMSVPCAATGSTTIGGSCALTTTLDTLVGAGATPEGTRAVYAVVGGVDVFDGGSDGDVDTPAGDTLFATGGLFVP